MTSPLTPLDASCSGPFDAAERHIFADYARHRMPFRDAERRVMMRRNHTTAVRLADRPMRAFDDEAFELGHVDYWERPDAAYWARLRAALERAERKANPERRAA